jgi:hypothetical protein
VGAGAGLHQGQGHGRRTQGGPGIVQLGQHAGGLGQTAGQAGNGREKDYQNILQLNARFWADADTLHVAVVVPILRTDRKIVKGQVIQLQRSLQP